MIPPPMRVLLVDDDLDYLSVLEQALKDRGLDVVTAQSPSAAREVMAQCSIDVVMTDLSLFGGTESEAIAAFDDGTPILFLTGSNGPFSQPSLLKPASLEVIMETLDEICPRQGA